MTGSFSGSAKNNAGFSLIEISVVMCIIGIFVAALVPLYAQYMRDKQEQQLSSTFETVQKNIGSYLGENGVYPCPASSTAQQGAAGFAESYCPPASVAAGSCDRGVCVYQNALGARVFVGTVPTRTLEIPSTNMQDPYRGRLTYAVSAALADPASVLPKVGAITIMEEDVVLKPDAPFVLLTHGKDQRGGYSPAGTQAHPCRNAVNQGDAENCDGDTVFRVNAGMITREGNNYYDDEAIFSLQDETTAPAEPGTGWVPYIY